MRVVRQADDRASDLLGSHDNAQRVDETGYGVRLRTYECVGGELAAAVDRVLADEQLRVRCAAAGERLRRRPGTELAADLIEALV